MSEEYGVYHDELSLPLWAQRRIARQRRLLKYGLRFVGDPSLLADWGMSRNEWMGKVSAELIDQMQRKRHD